MPLSSPHAPSTLPTRTTTHRKGDIAEAQTARNMVDRALNPFARIDCLVNDAGVLIGKPFSDCTLHDYDLISSVSLARFFHLTQRVIGQMVTLGSGHVFNVTISFLDKSDSHDLQRCLP